MLFLAFSSWCSFDYKFVGKMSTVRVGGDTIGAIYSKCLLYGYVVDKKLWKYIHAQSIPLFCFLVLFKHQSLVLCMGQVGKEEFWCL